MDNFKELIIQAQNGDEKAKEKLVNDNSSVMKRTKQKTMIPSWWELLVLFPHITGLLLDPHSLILSLQ